MMVYHGQAMFTLLSAQKKIRYKNIMRDLKRHTSKIITTLMFSVHSFYTIKIM